MFDSVATSQWSMVRMFPLHWFAQVGGEGLAPSGQTLLGWVDVADMTKALLQRE
jgi:hypothetical protein